MHRGYHHRGDFEGYGVYGLSGFGAITAGMLMGGSQPSTSRVGTAPAPASRTGVVVSPTLSGGAVRIAVKRPLFTGQSGRYVRQPRPTGRQTATFRLPPTASPPLRLEILTISPGIPQIGFVEQQGLWFVEEQARPVLSTALGAMSYSESSAADPITGQANFMLGQISGDAKTRVEGKIGEGYAALLNKASVQSGVLQLLFTQNPAVIVGAAAGPAAQYALIDDEPAGLVDQAVAMAGGQVAPPTLPPQPVTPPPPPPAGTGELPKWVMPVMIGVGVLAVGAILYTASASKKRAA